MKFSHLLLSSLLLPLALSAAPTISIQTTCQPPQGVAFTTDHGCGAGGGSMDYSSGGSSATASATVTIPTDPSAYTVLQVSQTVFAAPGWAADAAHPTREYDTMAESKLSVTDQLMTAGPERPGYVEFSVRAWYDRNPGDARAGGTLTIPQYEGGFTDYYSMGSIGPHTFPIELGTPFPLAFSGHLWAGSNFSDGTGAALSNLTYYVRFLEADGVTPVAVSDAPEPGTIGLLAFALLPLVWFAKKSQKNVRVPCSVEKGRHPYGSSL